MVYCSGLENPAGDSMEPEEMADFCGSTVAQDALFPSRSAGRDGYNVGTAPKPKFLSDEPSLEEFKRWRRSMGVCAEASYTYFMWGRAYHLIKIGRSWDPWRRSQEMALLHSQGIELVATVRGDYEICYHALFSEHRVKGEWFSPAPEILAEIERLKATP